MSTIFSQIVSGELPADIVYKDEYVTCFKDINPVAPVHLLIIPNKEIATVNDLTDEDQMLAGHMVLTAARLASEFGVDKSGYRLVMNCNQEGGQVVYHLHMHLVGGRQMGSISGRK